MLDFLFENKIQTMDRLAKMHGQKIVETTVRFGIWKQDWNYGRLGLNEGQKTFLKQRLEF